MSQKHNQRTRAQILARRNAPSPLPAPIVLPTSLVHKLAQRYIDGLRFTAATRRSTRSKYVPHIGANQR